MTNNFHASAAPLLEIRGLTVRFGGLLAVSELDLQVEQGQIFVLVGPNGAGKTTVLNCISGFVRPSAGSVTLDGTALLPLGRDRRARLGIGRTFQQLQLFSTMTVLDNLLTAQHTQLRAGLLQGMLPFGPAKAEDKRAREHARAILALLGLEGYAERTVSTLPFGIQKLVGVARALVLRPRLVLLDEPAAGMTHQETELLATHLRHWRDELGTTLLLIEHNMRLVQAVSDCVCVLDYGRKLAEGPAKVALADPAVLKAYLGSETLNVGEDLHAKG
ncbi:MAG TPA: ABC transporter ATP-binding protein [Ktedonobacteraceae bacterium]|jgi:branched-chain amino acid transport system ATP-binding protein|nr:ABC transporter ATP-binding protein [Ktedonobacteraceae bacterium]